MPRSRVYSPFCFAICLSSVENCGPHGQQISPTQSLHSQNEGINDKLNTWFKSARTPNPMSPPWHLAATEGDAGRSFCRGRESWWLGVGLAFWMAERWLPDLMQNQTLFYADDLLDPLRCLMHAVEQIPGCWQQCLSVGPARTPSAVRLNTAGTGRVRLWKHGAKHLS